MTEKKEGVTPFGTVTDHLIYNTNRGWFRSGSPESFPLHHVTSVQLEVRRRPIFGVVLVIAALACRTVLGTMGIVVAIVPLGFAALFLWGSPLVLVRTADRKLLAGGLPWTRPEAEWFVAAVERQRTVGTSRTTPPLITARATRAPANSFDLRREVGLTSTRGPSPTTSVGRSR